MAHSAHAHTTCAVPQREDLSTSKHVFFSKPSTKMGEIHGDTVDGPAKSQSPVDGKHPITYRVSTCFNHPYGGAGFGNHPQYHQCRERCFGMYPPCSGWFIVYTHHKNGLSPMGEMFLDVPSANETWQLINHP